MTGSNPSPPPPPVIPDASATYDMDVAAIVTATRRIRPVSLVWFEWLLLVAASGSLVLLFAGVTHRPLVLVIFVASPLWLISRFGARSAIKESIDDFTDGGDRVTVTVTATMEHLEIDDGLGRLQLQWSLFTGYELNDELLILRRRARAMVVIPRAKVSPRFIDALTNQLDGRSARHGRAPRSGVQDAIWLMAGLAVSLVALTLFVKWTDRPQTIPRIEPTSPLDPVGRVPTVQIPPGQRCPDGQLAIFMETADGTYLKICP